MIPLPERVRLSSILEHSMKDATPFLYTANELFDWLSGHPDFVLLDVRNDKDFTNFSRIEVSGTCRDWG